MAKKEKVKNEKTIPFYREIYYFDIRIRGSREEIEKVKGELEGRFEEIINDAEFPVIFDVGEVKYDTQAEIFFPEKVKE